MNGPWCAMSSWYWNVCTHVIKTYEQMKWNYLYSLPRQRAVGMTEITGLCVYCIFCVILHFRHKNSPRLIPGECRPLVSAVKCPHLSYCGGNYKTLCNILIEINKSPKLTAVCWQQYSGEFSVSDIFTAVSCWSTLLHYFFEV